MEIKYASAAEALGLPTAAGEPIGATSAKETIGGILLQVPHTYKVPVHYTLKGKDWEKTYTMQPDQ